MRRDQFTLQQILESLCPLLCRTVIIWAVRIHLHPPLVDPGPMGNPSRTEEY